MSNRTIIEVNHDLPAPVRVVEEMARELCGHFGRTYDELPERATYLQRKSSTDAILDRKEARDIAKALLMVPRRHGFIDVNGIGAIYAEEDANGEPRSSAMQVGK